jgi:hypothetical protein
MGFVDLSFSPLAQLLPDRCTPELRRVQAELAARHSFREAAQLLSTLLPCSPANHATIRNRTHRVAAEIEAKTPEAPRDVPALNANDEIVVMIDGAHIRAVPGYQSRHLDVTVGKVEVSGRRPRRFALAPKGSDHPLTPVRAALVEQGWHPGRALTVISDGEAALPNLLRAATGGLCAIFWIVGVDGPRRHRCARMRSLLISDKGDRPWTKLAELGWIRRSTFSSFMG